jgi:hypothetical protein
MSIRRIAVSGLVAVLLLTGCASKNPAGSGAASNAPSVPTSSTTEGLPPGIGLRYSNGFDDVVGVFDPKTGAPLREVKLPANMLPDPQRNSFDRTMRQLVYVTQCDLYLASLDQDEFQTIGHWQPPQSYSQRECFQSAIFRPDGRIWVDGSAASGSPAKLWSLDPAHPNSQLRDETSVGSTQDRQLSIDGNSNPASLRPSDGVRPARLEIGSDGSDAIPSYTCQPVDQTTFVCVYQPSGDSDFGGVAAAKVDLAAGKVHLKQLAPADKPGGLPSPPPDVLVASDHQRVAIRDQGVWFVAPLDGSQQPTQLPLEQNTILVKPLFWS